MAFAFVEYGQGRGDRFEHHAFYLKSSFSYRVVDVLQVGFVGRYDVEVGAESFALASYWFHALVEFKFVDEVGLCEYMDDL